MGEYSFCHNGTVIRYPKLIEPGVRPPQGETDSERFFNWLMCHYDAADPRGSLRKLVKTCIERSAFSGLNFLFSDGERLYAYKLGIFELHWLVRPGQTLVSSEIITPEESWHTVQEDVLLVLDPNRPESPHAERLVGDEWSRGRDRQVRAGAAPPRRRARQVRGRARRARRGGRRRVSERRLALFANPAAAGGRALARCRRSRAS